MSKLTRRVIALVKGGGVVGPYPPPNGFRWANIITRNGIVTSRAAPVVKLQRAS